MAQGSYRGGHQQEGLEPRSAEVWIDGGAPVRRIVDDLQKLMGHVEGSDVTQDVYDLADLETHRRIAASRVAYRKSTEK